MKLCMVISNAFPFLQRAEACLRLVLDPWGIQEAVSYEQAEELLKQEPVQLVLVDEDSMPTSPGAFYRTQREKYPDTWFVHVGKTKYPEVMHLDSLRNEQSLCFFMQQSPTEENRQMVPWFREYMAGIYPILMGHLWNGLLNRWVLSDKTMIMMAARRMNIPNLENRQILPILMKTVHKNKVETDYTQATCDHIYFQELLVHHVLVNENAGATLDRFFQKWAVIYYCDMYPASVEELTERCERAINAAEEENWQLSFYIGHPCFPDELLEQWGRLENLSEEDAGYRSCVTQLERPKHHPVAEMPDMNLWKKLLEKGECAEAAQCISRYILDLAQEDQLDTQWLTQFRDDFLLVVYHVLQVHGIPVEKILTEQMERETFNRSAASVRQLHGWVSRILKNISEFLESESADTVIKKAQKYILQNLDQPLSRDDIAAHVYVSSGYLGRIFKRETGISLSEYIYNERMKLAEKMLEQSELYVTSIALNVGFSNFPYFSTQFKKFSGLTPVEYRKKYRDVRSDKAHPVDKPLKS